MTTGQKFDRILDQVIRFADKDSIDGRFSYTKPNRPRGLFTMTLDGVEYEVSMVPAAKKSRGRA